MMKSYLITDPTFYSNTPDTLKSSLATVCFSHSKAPHLFSKIYLLNHHSNMD